MISSNGGICIVCCRQDKDLIIEKLIRVRQTAFQCGTIYKTPQPDASTPLPTRSLRLGAFMEFGQTLSGEVDRLRDELARGRRIVSVSGLSSTPSKAFVISRLQAEAGKNFVIVTDSNTDAEQWYCDLLF